MSQTQIDQAKDLIKQINHYDHEYFTNNRSLISDEEYDKLWFQLKSLLADASVRAALKKTDMPLGEQTSHLAKIKHLMPVLSLDKIKWDSPTFQHQLENFDQKYGTDHKYSVQSKLDGLTIVIYKYHGDVTFATRGGGITGENVTEQFRKIKPLWDAAQNIPEGMMVRGEAIIPKDDFAEINQKLNLTIERASAALKDQSYQTEIAQLTGLDVQKSDAAKKSLKKSIRQLEKDKDHDAYLLKIIVRAADNLYANARNLASASVRTLNTNTAKQHHVKMILYDVMNSEMFDLKTENDCLTALASYGFETVKNQLMTFNELQDWFQTDKPNQWRDSEPVEIDGIVIKPDVKIEHPDLTKHHQKGEIAVKYPPETKPSVLRSVSWTVGSAGRLTPVANFDPVALGGSLVKAASLGSWNTIKKLGLKIGDHVIIERSNDVIPQIRSVDTSQRTGSETDIRFPDNAVLNLNGGIIYSLSAQLPLPDLCARYCKTVKIDGAGKGFWKKIISQTNHVQALHDIYKFDQYADDLTDVSGIGQKKIDQVREQIQLSIENTTFDRVLLGLNQPGLGEKAVAQFVTVWPTCEDFTDQSQDEFDASLKKFNQLDGVNSLAVKGTRYLFDHHQELSAICSYLLEA